MDYNKIGSFIAQERKAKKLTQSKLAEKLFVSEKTISKWEKGKGLPDTNLLPKLCEILEVSLNELLNGERNNLEQSKQNNEQILLSMAKEIEQKNKIIWSSMWVIMYVSLTALFAGILISVFLIPCFYALKLEVSVGVYKCKKCGCEITPSYQEALWAMHRGTTRYLMCPMCKKRNWCRKVIK